MDGALLLDLDGTLVDSIPCWIDAYLETLRDYGLAMSRSRFIVEIYQQTDPLPGVLAAHGMDVTIEAFRRVRDARYLALLETRVDWLPGAEALLASLERPIGIVTTSWQAYVDAIDRRLGLAERVDTVVALEDAAGKPKPHGFPLELAAERLGADPSRSAYVGDQAHDMTAARNAGMEGWLVEGPETPEAAHRVAHRVLPDLAAVGAAWAGRDGGARAGT